MLKALESRDAVNKNRKGAKGGLVQKFMRFIQGVSGSIMMPKLGVYGYNLQHDSHNAH